MYSHDKLGIGFMNRNQGRLDCLEQLLFKTFESTKKIKALKALEGLAS